MAFFLDNESEFTDSKAEFTDLKAILNQFDSEGRISSQNFLIIYQNFTFLKMKNKKWQCSSDQRANVHVFIKEYFG